MEMQVRNLVILVEPGGNLRDQSRRVLLRSSGEPCVNRTRHWAAPANARFTRDQPNSVSLHGTSAPRHRRECSAQRCWHGAQRRMA